MNVQWKNFDYRDAATKYNFDAASKYFKFNQNRPTASNIKPNNVPGIVRLLRFIAFLSSQNIHNFYIQKIFFVDSLGFFRNYFSKASFLLVSSEQNRVRKCHKSCFKTHHLSNSNFIRCQTERHLKKRPLYSTFHFLMHLLIFLDTLMITFYFIYFSLYPLHTVFLGLTSTV